VPGYPLTRPQNGDAVCSQKVLIFHGECYERLGYRDLAFKAHLRALNPLGRNEDAVLRLGDPYLRTENPKAAIPAYRRAVGMDDATIRGHAELAAAFLATGPTQEAAMEIVRVEGLGGDVEELRKRPFATTDSCPGSEVQIEVVALSLT